MQIQLLVQIETSKLRVSLYDWKSKFLYKYIKFFTILYSTNLKNAYRPTQILKIYM